MFGAYLRRDKTRLVKTPDEQFKRKRDQMIEHQLIARGISDPLVLSAFHKVPRHLFVPPVFESKAYEDHPIQIGFDQTISQPYVVALMLEQLKLRKENMVLEIGTGSGYQTALLAELAREVYSIETIYDLYQSAQDRLNSLGYSNVYLMLGNGRNGWSEKSPFDKIIVAAGTIDIPDRLIQQLKEGGLMIVPLGDCVQDLVLGRKVNGVLVTKQLTSVRFVPLVGNHEKN